MADGNQRLESRKEQFERLSHNCMAMGIWLLTPEGENEMTLNELKKMSTKELTALYNQHAEKQVKRMESRAKLEERTAQLLRDKDQLSEDAVDSTVPTKGKKRNIKPPMEAPETTTNEAGDEEMATNNTSARNVSKRGAPPPTARGRSPKTSAPAKKTSAPAKAAAKSEGEAKGKRGAPLTNHTYKAISEKSKKFNPGNNKLQASSARGLILEAIKKKEAGLTRQKLEEMYPEQNVKSALDVLVKFGFIEVAE